MPRVCDSCGVFIPEGPDDQLCSDCWRKILREWIIAEKNHTARRFKLVTYGMLGLLIVQVVLQSALVWYYWR